MKCVGPTFEEEQLTSLRDEFAFTPDIDELADTVSLFAHSTWLKIFALLEQTEQMCVCDLAAVLDISVSAVSQNLARERCIGTCWR